MSLTKAYVTLVLNVKNNNEHRINSRNDIWVLKDFENIWSCLLYSGTYITFKGVRHLSPSAS